MITSNQIIKLSEEWLSSISTFRGHTDLYKNPGSSDFLELNRNQVKLVRFIADSRSNNVYVANASTSIHYDIVSSVGGSVVSDFNHVEPTLLQGLASVSGSTAIVTESDLIEYYMEKMKKLLLQTIPDTEEYIKVKHYLDTVLNTNWSWLNRYIKVDGYLSRTRQIYKSILKNKK